MYRNLGSWLMAKLTVDGTQALLRLWHKIGLTARDEQGRWALTELGKQMGGKMLQKGQQMLPSFDPKRIEKLVADFCDKHRK